MGGESPPKGGFMKKFAIICALFVAFVCGMYANVALDYHNVLQSDYGMDQAEWQK